MCQYTDMEITTKGDKMSRKTYVVRRVGREEMYLQSYKVAKRIAKEEAHKGTMVGRINQNGTLTFLR